MKKLLLAATLAAITASAHAAPEVYGRASINLGYFDADEDGGDEDLNMGGYARLGFKGDMPLSAETDVLYKIEFQYSADPDETKSNQTQRDIWIGLKNAQYGELLAGRMYTVDDYVQNGWSNPSDYGNSGFQDGDYGARWNDAIRYTSPKYNDAVFRAQYKVDDSEVTKFEQAQNATFPSRKTTTTNDSGSFSLGVEWTPEGQPYSMGVSHNSYKGGDVDSATTVSGYYDMNDRTTLSAAYQLKNYDDGNLDDVNNLSIAGTYMYTPKAQTYLEYDYSDNVDGVDGNDQSSLSGGVWYDHTDNIASFGALGYTSSDNKSKDGFGFNTGMIVYF